MLEYGEFVLSPKTAKAPMSKVARRSERSFSNMRIPYMAIPRHFERSLFLSVPLQTWQTERVSRGKTPEGIRVIQTAFRTRYRSAKCKFYKVSYPNIWQSKTSHTLLFISLESAFSALFDERQSGRIDSPTQSRQTTHVKKLSFERYFYLPARWYICTVKHDLDRMLLFANRPQSRQTGRLRHENSLSRMLVARFNLLTRYRTAKLDFSEYLIRAKSQTKRMLTVWFTWPGSEFSALPNHARMRTFNFQTLYRKTTSMSKYGRPSEKHFQ